MKYGLKTYIQMHSGPKNPRSPASKLYVHLQLGFILGILHFPPPYLCIVLSALYTHLQKISSKNSKNMWVLVTSPASQVELRHTLLPKYSRIPICNVPSLPTESHYHLVIVSCYHHLQHDMIPNCNIPNTLLGHATPKLHCAYYVLNSSLCSIT
jgi:hypothetical protein